MKLIFSPNTLVLLLTLALVLPHPAQALRPEAAGGSESSTASGLEAALRGEAPSIRLAQLSVPIPPVSGAQSQAITGLETIDRRDFLIGSVTAAGVSALDLVLPSDLSAQEAPAKGALAPLTAKLGKGRGIGIVIWNANSLAADPNNRFFKTAVQAGVSTVWISGFRFNQLSGAGQQGLIDQAKEAGLRTLGFIDGNYDWVQAQRSKQYVSGHYDRLMSNILALNLGNKLQIAFSTDIEPYTQPAQTGWNGDLSGYSDLLEKVILPRVQKFAADFKTQHDRYVVYGTYLTRFEPFWYQNEREIEGGIRISGLRDIPNTDIAGMTYRDTTEGILSVSAAIRGRARAVNKVKTRLGSETLPPEEVGGDQVTFFGEEEDIPTALTGVFDRLDDADLEHLRGFFVHFSDPNQALQILDQWLEQRAMRDPGSSPAKETSKVQVVPGSLRRTDTQLSLKLKGAPPGARAIVLLKTDLFYWQPRSGSSVPVGRDGTVQFTTTFAPPNRPGFLRADDVVVLVFPDPAAVSEFLRKGYGTGEGMRTVPDRENIQPSPPLRAIRISKNGTLKVSFFRPAQRLHTVRELYAAPVPMGRPLQLFPLDSPLQIAAVIPPVEATGLETDDAQMRWINIDEFTALRQDIAVQDPGQNLHIVDRFEYRRPLGGIEPGAPSNTVVMESGKEFTLDDFHGNVRGTWQLGTPKGDAAGLEASGRRNRVRPSRSRNRPLRLEILEGRLVLSGWGFGVHSYTPGAGPLNAEVSAAVDDAQLTLAEQAAAQAEAEGSNPVGTIGKDGRLVGDIHPLEGGDGFIAPIDVLQIVNILTDPDPPFDLSQPIPDEFANLKPLDVNDDGFIAPIDALLVINFLNDQQPLLGINRAPVLSPSIIRSGDSLDATWTIQNGSVAQEVELRAIVTNDIDAPDLDVVFSEVVTVPANGADIVQVLPLAEQQLEPLHSSYTIEFQLIDTRNDEQIGFSRFTRFQVVSDREVLLESPVFPETVVFGQDIPVQFTFDNARSTGLVVYVLHFIRDGLNLPGSHQHGFYTRSFLIPPGVSARTIIIPAEEYQAQSFEPGDDGESWVVTKIRVYDALDQELGLPKGGSFTVVPAPEAEAEGEAAAVTYAAAVDQALAQESPAESIVQVWKDRMYVTTADDQRDQPLRPVLHPNALETVPLLIDGKVPFVAAVRSAEQAQKVQDLAEGFGALPGQVEILRLDQTDLDINTALAEREDELRREGFTPYRVDSERSNWYDDLLDQLGRIGAYAVGDLTPDLVHAIELYFAELA